MKINIEPHASRYGNNSLTDSFKNKDWKLEISFEDEVTKFSKIISLEEADNIQKMITDSIESIKGL